ncbi:MAG: hypothetical protein U0930_02360 [Pirellulales bacterium]
MRSCVACLLLIQAGCLLAADESLEKELHAVVVEHVIPMMEKRGHGPVAIGGFTAATSVKGSAGPEIQMKLSQMLQQLNVAVNADKYRYEITGNYLPYNDPQSELYGVKLITRLVDAEDGTTLGEFPRFVFGPESVPRMLGLTVSSKGSNDPKLQSVSFKKSVQTPEVFVTGAMVSASPVSPYSVELLVLKNGQYQAMPMSADAQSRPTAQFAKNDIYAIRLTNNSDHDAAVRLTIDGVNTFEFSEQSPQPNYWIVPRSKDGKPGTTIVRGWDKSAAKSIEFKVVDFPDSAAAKIKLQPSQVGMISASFAACWENDNDRPRSEGRTRSTGFGSEIVDQKTLVKRHVGQVRDVISVRYERNPSPADSISLFPR